MTQPDRPAGRGHKLQPTPVKRAALEAGIRAIEPERLRDAFDVLAGARADLFAVASYGKIVSQRILDLAPLGALNVHPSLLPLYRGATPLQSQLRDGVARGGVSIIAMDAGMDTGDVVLQQRSAIGLEESYGALHDRFAGVGAELLARACREAAAGTLVRIPQSLLGSEDEARRTATRISKKDDLMIDWTRTATQIVDHVRSLSPQPCARAAAFADGVDAKILAAHVASVEELRAFVPSTSQMPGTPLPTRLGTFVRTGSGFVAIDALVPPSRGVMTGLDYARGRA